MSLSELNGLNHDELKRFNFNDKFNINLSDLYQTLSMILNSPSLNSLSKVTSPIFLTNSAKSIEVMLFKILYLYIYNY